LNRSEYNNITSVDVSVNTVIITGFNIELILVNKNIRDSE